MSGIEILSGRTDGRAHMHMRAHAHTHTHHVVDQGQSHGKHQCLSAKNSLREKEEEMISRLGEGTEKRDITEA